MELNAGHEIVERIANEIAAVDLYDFVIVGVGAPGLSAAIRAQDFSLRAVVLEANYVAETVYTMTKGKVLFLPARHTVPLRASMWFEECAKEDLLAKRNEQVAEKQLDIREFEKLLEIRRKDKTLEVESQKENYKARRVILAVGKVGNPRKAGVEGEIENAARIAHRLLDLGVD